MNFKKTMAALKAAGSETAAKTYRRHGAPDPMFGVRFADYEKLAKQIGTDHDLAQKLWESGNHDARVLATYVIDHEAVTAKHLDTWIKELQNRFTCEVFAGMAAKTPHATKKATQWRKRKDEWVATVGWSMTPHLLSGKTREAHGFSKAELLDLIKTIESTIEDVPNFTRYAMNGSLIAIGTYRNDVANEAIAAAKRIGKVDVDHGDTSCKTPFAPTYIEKSRAHIAHREARRAKKKAAKKGAAKKKASKKKKIAKK